jgi:AcrR family transcriptional regulator
MSPRNSVVEAQRTRQRIVEHSLSVASLNGLEGLTIGRIATDLGLSKAGVLGHFGTKEGLQLAVVDAASELFAREVPQRVPADAEPGLPRLRGYCEAWVSYVERDVLPGGCFFTAAASEFDGRGGPVRDALAAKHALWQRVLAHDVRCAVATGELPPDADADQVAFELFGIIMAMNHYRQLTHDPAASTRARRALHRLLGP